jgi:hypothetical protein
MKKRLVKPKSGQVITVGNHGPPRLLIQNKLTGDLNAMDFSGEVVAFDVINSRVLFDNTYLFAAHDLESYFKKQLEIPK